MSEITQDIPSTLQISNVARIKYFIKSTFLGYSDPYLESKKEIKNLRYKLKTDEIAQKYLSKNLTFSKQFIISIAYIHKYMESFRNHISFDSFFKTEDFPLFLLSQYSSTDQLEMYFMLTDPQKIKMSIAQNGLTKAKAILKQTFVDYKNSFSADQIYEVQKILDLGNSFYTFLQYNLTNLILMLYPSYHQDENLIQLDKTYKPLDLHYIYNEIESFVTHLSVIKSNNNYYDFIHFYSQFFKIKMITKKEFNLLFKKVNEFVSNDLLLNLVQVQDKNDLIFCMPPKINYTKPNVVSILKEISTKTTQSHHQAISIFVDEVEENTLEYMFDKQTIQQIKHQQYKIDAFLDKKHNEKSATSISLVLMAFSEKIFYKSIQPSLEFLIQNTVFVLPEFKKDLVYYIQVIIKNFKDIKTNIQKCREIMESGKENLYKINIKSKEISQDFLNNTEILHNLLETIIHIGTDELKNKLQFIIPKDKIEKLIKNLQISDSLMNKMYQYIQISFQTHDIF